MILSSTEGINAVVPLIDDSTKEQRKEYIKKTYKCKADCENCGMCKVLKGRIPEIVFEDYINGKTELSDIRI